MGSFAARTVAATRPPSSISTCSDTFRTSRSPPTPSAARLLESAISPKTKYSRERFRPTMSSSQVHGGRFLSRDCPPVSSFSSFGDPARRHVSQLPVSPVHIVEQIVEPSLSIPLITDSHPIPWAVLQPALKRGSSVLLQVLLQLRTSSDQLLLSRTA